MNNSYFSNETFLGFNAIRFCHSGYEALILPEMGANVVELIDTQKNLNILRKPDFTLSKEAFSERPQLFGIPVLFPPNRITNGTFTVKGKTYNFPVNSGTNHIHGFLHKRPWTVVSQNVFDDKISLELEFNCNSEIDFFENFPHEFLFTLTYTLSKNGLLQEIKIKNNSKEHMPIGLGFHTAFNIPFSENKNIDDYRLKTSIDKQWPLIEMLPQGEPKEINSENIDFIKDGVKPVGSVLDNLHFSTKLMQHNGKQLLGSVLTDTKNNINIVYEWGKEFGQTVIWNDSGDKNYVCPEPQTWAINAPNLNLDDSITGLKTLAPGEVFETETKIYVD